MTPATPIKQGFRNQTGNPGLLRNPSENTGGLGFREIDSECCGSNLDPRLGMVE